ncbi:MAG TPA: low specificity L-threonine aldolase [Thermoanaerobaculia bacterium]|jgi:threonine aldolase|nr:low specificity L-threonine aldolase [Thermoanaerobaculia bacterium]
MSADFRSDNTHGCSPEILDAIARASAGTQTSYGGDDSTAAVRRRCSEIFETDVEIFPVISGTAGNSLAIAALTPPWGAVFCHEDAHIQRDECGAPEFFSGGAKLIPIAGADGKLHPDDLARAIRTVAESKRTAVPACISITNATEAGTVYSAEEMRVLCGAGNLSIHLDGARFANAVAATGATPADLTWRAGVDLLTFGATKNGALAAEAIVVFRKSLAEELALRHHRAGQRISKMRFISAQLDAYLADDLWLRNARHANAMAQRLARGLKTIHPVEANVVFARFPLAQAAALRAQGFRFGDWPIFGDDAHRLVTAFDTTEEEVDGFLRAARSQSSVLGPQSLD